MVEIYRGLVNLIRKRDDGYYDFQKKRFFKGTQTNYIYQLQPYDGLSEVYAKSYASADKLDFSNTVLPWKWQYNKTLATSKFCLMPVGVNYDNIKAADYSYNFTVVGTPTIDNNNEIVSNFGINSYLTATGGATYGSELESFEMVLHIKTGTSLGEAQRIYQPAYGTSGADSVRAPTVNCSTESIALFYHGTNSGGDYYTNIKAVSNPTPNTEYWLKWVFDGTYIHGYMSTDGITYTLTESVEYDAFWTDNTFKWGIRDAGYTETLFTGAIYFEDTYIKLNNIDWWKAEFSAYPKSNMSTDLSVTGALTISDDLVVSNFYSNRYLTLNNTIPLSAANNAEIVMKYNLTTTSYNSCIIGNAGDDYQSGGFVLRNDGGTRLLFFASINKTAWDVLSFDTGIDVATGINYVKIAWTGSGYVFYDSSDGISWIERNTCTTAAISDFAPRLGISGSNFYIRGSIDLKGCYVKINGEIWWQGAIPVIETLAGCTYNFTDTGAAVTLNCFAVNGDESIVLTPDATYQDNRLLGTVSIPTHTVYSYNNGVWTEV